MLHEADSVKPTARLIKTPTGINGLDDVLNGGLPQGRPTLVCGTAGCGKTMLSMEFLIHGAVECNEPGVFVAFEETYEDLVKNVASLGFDLETLIAEKKLIVDYVHIDRTEIEENGEFDLEGLFIRLNYIIDSISAKRIALDTLEILFSGLPNDFIIRSELLRLFRWLKVKGMTAIITAERGDGTLTRHGLEEYVSDCVILLDHRVTGQISTRRLRVVKYRGSVHGTNEYPFLIDRGGFTVLPITSMGLMHEVSNERVTSGIPKLDQMLGGKGYYRGSSVLISGTAGTGKSTFSACLANATCQRGERCLYFAFEESQEQIKRNQASVGLDLQPLIDKKLLTFHTSRPTQFGLETHLALIYKKIKEFKPHLVIIDPITNFTAMGTSLEINSMLMRLVDYLKSQQITAFFTSLTTPNGASFEQTDVGVSSIIDTWILLRDLEQNGERNRGIYVLKSRGMPHSNQIREVLISDTGIDLVDAYLGSSGVLTGSARLAREAYEREMKLKRNQELDRKQQDFTNKRLLIENKINMLRNDLQAEESEIKRLIEFEQQQEKRLQKDKCAMARSRHVDFSVIS